MTSSHLPIPPLGTLLHFWYFQREIILWVGISLSSNLQPLFLYSCSKWGSGASGHLSLGRFCGQISLSSSFLYFTLGRFHNVMPQKYLLPSALSVKGGFWIMLSSSILASLMCEASQHKVLIIYGWHTGMSLGHSIIYSLVLSFHGLY